MLPSPHTEVSARKARGGEGGGKGDQVGGGQAEVANCFTDDWLEWIF